MAELPAHDWQENYGNAMRQAAALQQELTELRQAVWDARATLGFDNETVCMTSCKPGSARHPTLAELIKRDATEFRKDYDDSLAESTKLEATLATLRVLCWELINGNPLAKLRGFLVETSDRS